MNGDGLGTPATWAPIHVLACASPKPEAILGTVHDARTDTRGPLHT
jgi:hypothetical protein